MIENAAALKTEVYIHISLGVSHITRNALVEGSAICYVPF
jgi:hypothetical protein